MLMDNYITFVICFILGELIKLTFPKMEKKWLPFIIGALGMVFCPILCREFSAVNIANGLISGFASCGGYDCIHGLIKKYKALK